MMADAGIGGQVAIPKALRAEVARGLPSAWRLDETDPWQAPRLEAKILEALRLGMLAHGARQGGKNYALKLKAKRSPLATVEMAAWRALNRVTDPLPIIRRIGRALPVRWYFPHDCTHLILPTLIHEDVTQAQIVRAARAAGKPVWAVPASWDNLVTKGRFLDQPDRIAVWGIESGLHALDHHGFPEKNIAVVGPPHFWPYSATSGVPPMAIPEKYVVFAGTTVNYAPDEKLLVAQLANELRKAGLRHLIVYRPHPRAPKDQGEGLTAAGILMDPRWAGEWSLKREDIPYLKTLLSSATCTISAFSTVVIESALCGAPSILIGFGDSAHGTGKAIDHMQYEHMAAVSGKPGVWIAETMARVVDLIRACAGPQRVDPRPIRQWALDIAAVHDDPRHRMIRWLKEER